MLKETDGLGFEELGVWVRISFSLSKYSPLSESESLLMISRSKSYSFKITLIAEEELSRISSFWIFLISSEEVSISDSKSSIKNYLFVQEEVHEYT